MSLCALSHPKRSETEQKGMALFVFLSPRWGFVRNLYFLSAGVPLHFTSAEGDQKGHPLSLMLGVKDFANCVEKSHYARKRLEKRSKTFREGLDLFILR